jgi:hypothetical protein
MFKLISSTINIKEISMKADMTGKVFRRGIKIAVVVDKSDVELFTEALRVLELRPVFVEGNAMKKEPTNYNQNYAKDRQVQCKHINTRTFNNI